MIDRLEHALKELIISELTAIGAKHLVSSDRILSAVGESPSDVPVLVLGLSTVNENTTLRDQSLHTFKRPDGRIAAKNRAAVRLNLHYIVTASAPDAATERQVLSEALAAMFRCQLKVKEAQVPETVQFGAKLLSIEIAQSDQPLSSGQARLWYGDPLRDKPYFNLTATLEFNPYEPKEVHLVREAIIGLTRKDSAQRHVERGLARTIASLAGIVLDPNGKAISEAVVSLEPGGQEAVSSSEGVFVFFNLLPGSYSGAVKAAGFLDVRFKASAPAFGEAGPLEPLVFELEFADSKSMFEEEQETAGLNKQGKREIQPTKLSYITSALGRLVFEDGSPAAYYIVRCGSKATMTDGNGFWRLEITPDEEGRLEAVLGPNSVKPLVLGAAETLVPSPNT